MQGKVLNLEHLYFDIVSDLELRISDFASLGIFTIVENPLQIDLFFAKRTQIPTKSNERKYLLYKELSNFYPAGGAKNKPNSNPIKPNCRKGKIDAKCIFTKDYEEKCG